MLQVYDKIRKEEDNTWCRAIRGQIRLGFRLWLYDQMTRANPAHSMRDMIDDELYELRMN